MSLAESEVFECDFESVVKDVKRPMSASPLNLQFRQSIILLKGTVENSKRPRKQKNVILTSKWYNRTKVKFVMNQDILLYL